MRSRAIRLSYAALGWLALIAVLAACASTSGRASVASSAPPASTSTTVRPEPATTSAAPTTAVGQVPTVPNCGGGAYKPQTLLIVCGSGTTTATGVSWRSWGSASASGSGTVHLQVKGQAVAAPAALLLTGVVDGPVGPQFTRLTVTWTGTPPDGNARDTYHLQVQG